MIELPPPLWLPPRPAIIRPADKKLLRRADRAHREANFLPGMFPAGAIAAGSLPPNISFMGLTTGPGSGQNFTLNTVAIGAADPTRRVVFCVVTTASSVFRTISTFTVDGVSILPAHITVNASGFNSGHLAIFSVLKPTGTTANLQVNANGTLAQISVHTFRAVNETSASPHATMTDGTISGNTVSSTINIPNNGWVMAAANGFGTSSQPTGIDFTGVTEVVDGVIGTNFVRTASGIQSLLPVQTGRAVSAVVNNATVGQTAGLIGISWG